MTLAAYENPATTYMLGTSSEQSFGKHTREDASPLHQKQVSRSLSYLDLLGSSRSSSLQSVFPRYTQELLLNLGMQQQQQQQQHQPQDSSLWSNHQRSSSLRSIGSQQDVLNLGSLAGAQQLRSRSSSTGSSSSSETVAPIMTGTFSCGPNSPKRSFDEMMSSRLSTSSCSEETSSVASTSSGQHYQSNIDLVALLSKSQSPSRTMNSLRSESFSSASSHPGHFQQQQQQVSDEYLPRESRKRPRLGSFVSGDSLLQQFPFLAQSKADSILSRPPSTQHQPQQYQETSAFSSQYFSALNNTNLPRTDSRESLLLELQRQQQQQQQQQNPPPVPVVQAPLQEISKPCSKRSKRAGKLCTVEGCNTRDKGGGLCAKHGGGRPCKHQGCTKIVAGLRFCSAHGGTRKKKCSMPSCNKGDQGGGFCAAHGGGRRCTFANCQRRDIGRGLCWTHGGGRRCSVRDCLRCPVIDGFCKLHFSPNGSEPQE
eukprot:CAMPEP_0171497562 /NCGR_PEP_ID=MMETSP0958-20121227/7344_1 /TAXON_ID=87120 /ORGANISM="Aurantiochytrium limacinum, Strain ATCCMYA-1381" /LENGTH=482 /DNA_ID=CAMNT_0012031825 /DNA_START=349 /DNA_END=1797 /DNA_ORIENTATION=-